MDSIEEQNTLKPISDDFEDEMELKICDLFGTPYFKGFF